MKLFILLICYMNYSLAYANEPIKDISLTFALPPEWEPFYNESKPDMRGILFAPKENISNKTSSNVIAMRSYKKANKDIKMMDKYISGFNNLMKKDCQKLQIENAPSCAGCNFHSFSFKYECYNLSPQRSSKGITYLAENDFGLYTIAISYNFPVVTTQQPLELLQKDQALWQEFIKSIKFNETGESSGGWYPSL